MSLNEVYFRLLEFYLVNDRKQYRWKVFSDDDDHDSGPQF